MDAQVPLSEPNSDDATKIICMTYFKKKNNTFLSCFFCTKTDGPSTVYLRFDKILLIITDSRALNFFSATQNIEILFHHFVIIRRKHIR